MFEQTFRNIDIATRKIYWTSEVIGEVGGKGYTQAYGLGLVNSTKRYVDKVYNNFR